MPIALHAAPSVALRSAAAVRFSRRENQTVTYHLMQTHGALNTFDHQMPGSGVIPPDRTMLLLNALRNSTAELKQVLADMAKGLGYRTPSQAQPLRQAHVRLTALDQQLPQPEDLGTKEARTVLTRLHQMAASVCETVVQKAIELGFVTPESADILRRTGLPETRPQDVMIHCRAND